MTSPVKITPHGRFRGDQIITFTGIRWVRAYGLIGEEFNGGDWMGGAGWKLLAGGRVARCKYGNQPAWIAARPWLKRTLTTLYRLLPTAAGRHERMMRREHPDIVAARSR